MISQRQPPASAPARTYLGRVVPGYMLRDAQMVAGEGLAGPIPGLTLSRESGVMEGGSLVLVTVGCPGTRSPPMVCRSHARTVHLPRHNRFSTVKAVTR